MKYILLISLQLIFILSVKSQKTTTTIYSDSLNNDSLSKFEIVNKKAEALFKILPVPMMSYSTETGTVFGAAKYNMVQLVKDDTVSSSSSFSELVSISTKGQFKVVIKNNMYFDRNKIVLNANVQYIKYPEYILGVGNDVNIDNIEHIITQRFIFSNYTLFAINKSKTLYTGIYQEFKNYFNVKKDSINFLDQNNYPGKNGGISSGFGLGSVYDTRDNKYNAKSGVYISLNYKIFGEYVGSDFTYNSLELDIRKYFNPWLEHVVAFQFYTQPNTGDVSFFSLAQLGGVNRMRGYYLGMIRDKKIADAQIEYRIPIWSIIGITAFASTGRVAEYYKNMTFNGLWYAGGFGLRIMVDKKSKANLRFDLGFGQKGAKAFIVGFTEAF